MIEKLAKRVQNRLLEFVANLNEEGVAPHAILSFLRIRVVATGTVSPDENAYIAPRLHDGHLDTLVVTTGADQQGKKNIEVVVSGSYWGPILKQLTLTLIYGDRYYLTHPKEKGSGEEGFVASEVRRILSGENDLSRVIYPEGGRGRAGKALQTGIFAVAAELALHHQLDVHIQLAVLENMDPVFRKNSNAVLDLLWLLARAGRYKLTGEYHESNVAFLEPLQASQVAALTDPNDVDALKRNLVAWYEGQYEEYLSRGEYTRMPDAFASYVATKDGAHPIITHDDSEVFDEEPTDDRYRFLSQEPEHPSENQV